MSGTFARRRRGRMGVAVAAALLGLGVASCGTETNKPDEMEWSDSKGDQDKQQSEDEATPTPDEPKEFTFAKKYIDAMSTAMKSGDGSALRQLATENCSACTTMADFQENLHAKGGKYLDDPSYKKIRLIKGPKKGDENLTWIRVAATQPEVKQQKKQGGPTVTVGGAEEFTDFGLAQKGGSWKVATFCGVTKSRPTLGCPGS